MSKEKKEFEIVEFYPELPFHETAVGAKKLGSLHIYACSIGLDIRGCPALMLKNGFVMVYLPNRQMKNKEGRSVRFPLIDFTDQRMKKECRRFLKEEASPFVKERVRAILEKKT